MAEFEEQQMFQGAAQSQGFAPLESPDISRFLRENMGVIDSNFARLQSQQQAELDRKLKEKQDLLTTLGQFSTTALEFAKTQGQAYIDSEILKGHTKARSLGKTFGYGIDPAKEKELQAAEQSAKADSAKAANAAVEAAKQGAPMEAVSYIKSLPAYQRIGATRAYLANKGSGYKQFLAEFLQRTDIELAGPGERKFKPNEAYQDRALMSIALAAASEIFDAQEVGIGAQFSPSPLAMKGLYEAKDEAENAFIINADRNKNIDESAKRVETAINIWTTNGELGPLFNEVLGTYDRNGNIRSRSEVLDFIFQELLVDAYAAGDKEVLNQLDQPILDDNGQPTGQTWRQRFKNRIEGEKGLNAKVEAIERRERAKRDEEFQDKIADYKQAFYDAVAEQRKAGTPFNEETIRSMREKAAIELGIPAESPLLNYFDDYTTKESRDAEQDTERLLALRRSRGFLIEEDLRDVPDSVYNKFIGSVEEDQGIAERPKSFVSDNQKLITAFTNDHFNVTLGDAPKTPEWENMARRAREAEAGYYAEYIRAGSTPEEAQALTRKRLEENFKAGTYTFDPKITPDVKYKRTLSSARNVMQLNPASIDKAVFVGTDAELKQLEKYDQGFTDTLPKLYHDLALGNRKLTAWDIAAAQYKAATGRNLKQAPVQQAIQSKSEAYKRYMQYRPTRNRGMRADAGSFRSQTSSLPNPTLKRAADIVSNYESAGSGGYNAVNQGGEAGGTKIPAGFYSGDFRKMPQHGGRDLTTLTIGEIMDLQADPGRKMSNQEWVKQGKLHAVGRYQFIGSTLRGLVQRLGIPRTAKFTPELQDRLFLSLLKSGGPGQWVGLRYAKPEEMAIINQARSQL